MFQQNPLTARERRAQGVIAGRSLVLHGTLSDEVAPASGINQDVIGYVADATADDASCTVQGAGALVELIAGETLVDGDYVISTSEVAVEKPLTHNPANNDIIYVIGRVEDKNTVAITVGLRVHVRLGFFMYYHGE